jgi:hypothetical protein
MKLNNCIRLMKMSIYFCTYFCRSVVAMENTISDFLCNTCRVRPKPSRHKFEALFHCIRSALSPINDGDYTWTVKVCPLIDTEFPGYVIVKSLCELIKSNNDDYYECFPTESGYASTTLHTGSLMHDTDLLYKRLNISLAVRTYKFSDQQSSRLSVDNMFCIRCLVWPPQAANWKTRPRKYGWPDLTTVERIVSNGCDVV